jgi:hypothetical protein
MCGKNATPRILFGPVGGTQVGGGIPTGWVVERVGKNALSSTGKNAGTAAPGL